MSIDRIRSFVLACLVAAWLPLVPSTAQAGVELGEGDPAVDFVGKEFINGEETSLRDLRGRLVLIELFSTG